jgi:Polyketide cyclase / dehydrase and lipid transport
MGAVVVAFRQPVHDVYAYLSDPARRPEWQGSLRRIEGLHGTGAVGTTWVDVTVVGARPAMEVTEATHGRTWVEIGRWRGITAGLRLEFEEASASGEGTTVRAEVDVTGPSWQRPACWALARLAPYAVRRDLQRAARTL